MESVEINWPYEGSEVLLYGKFTKEWKKYRMDHFNNKWSITIKLKPGTYEYKFIVDGKWFYDIMKPKIDDGFDGKNNILRVTNSSMISVVYTSSILEKTPEGDILIFSNKEYDLKTINEWLGKQKHTYKFVVLNNQDIKKIKSLEEASLIINNGTIMNGLNLKIKGITLCCLQPFKRTNSTSSISSISSISSNILEEMTKDIKDDIDVIITYDKPKLNNSLFKKIKLLKPLFQLSGDSNEKFTHSWKSNKNVTWDDKNDTVFIGGENINKPIVLHVKPKY